MVMAMVQWTKEDPQTLFPELCRRPADLDPDDKERGDRRARWQHLGHQRRLQRESPPGMQLPALLLLANHPLRFIFCEFTRLLPLRLLRLFQRNLRREVQIRETIIGYKFC